MEFMTREEVAKRLRVHTRTVERWLKGDLLVGHKLGTGKTSLWRIKKSEVEKFLAKSVNTKKK